MPCQQLGNSCTDTLGRLTCGSNIWSHSRLRDQQRCVLMLSVSAAPTSAADLVQRSRDRQLPAPSLRRPLREAAGLTLDEIAQYVGCTRQAVAYWESGERQPRGAFLVAYADVLREMQKAAS